MLSKKLEVGVLSDIIEMDIESEENDCIADPRSCQCQSLSCGNYLPRPDKPGCVSLKYLNDNVSHFYSADIEITDSELIYMRSPISLNPNGLICGNHRFKL